MRCFREAPTGPLQPPSPSRLLHSYHEIPQVAVLNYLFALCLRLMPRVIVSEYTVPTYTCFRFRFHFRSFLFHVLAFTVDSFFWPSSAELGSFPFASFGNCFGLSSRSLYYGTTFSVPFSPSVQETTDRIGNSVFYTRVLPAPDKFCKFCKAFIPLPDSSVRRVQTAYS